MLREKSDKLPTIGITMGDPKGIGPEVIQKALTSSAIRRICRPIVFGDAEFFDWKKAKTLSARDCGILSGFYIKQAAHAVLQGEIDAIVTGPICKEHLQKGGYPYPGHTEFLAALAGVKEVRMMMAGPKLKVVLVTIHEPIKKISSLLTRGLILKTIELTDRALKHWFGIPRPRIAVAALNPHAGEKGIFGHEEKEVIGPAIQMARRKAIDVDGPCPPDTLFWRAVHPRPEEKWDAVVVMYHDQGLIPLKLLHFEEAVNITLGLPFIRTSVDHGTAFDIAGKGIADPASLVAAIKLATQMARIRK